MIMCVSIATALLAATAATTATAIYSADKSRKASHAQMDMARNVETSATQTANARIAQRRRALASNSLVTDQSAGMASQGRATLGGG
jgi:hypothetical protein